MEEVLARFPIDGKPLSIVPLSGGHINRSCLVSTDSGRRYVLQQVNRYVFHDVNAIMENLRKLRDFLRRRGESLPMIGFIDTCDGAAFYEDSNGCAWRLCPYVENSLSLTRPDREEDCYQGGLAFGRFQYVLRDYPPEELTETIPRFHDTPERFRQLKAAMSADPCGRLSEVGTELAFVLEREERASFLQSCRLRGELPLRVTHNDTKIANVLLDAVTREALCVIDLDTVMPGLAAYDYGDAIRSFAATGEEDGGGIGLDLNFYRAFTRGFLETARHLTERERELLPLGAWTMTLECGVRFLTDYLNGDRYFAVSRPEQNLERARAQFSLAADMERKRDSMHSVFRTI